MTREGFLQRWRRWRLAKQGLPLERSCSVEACVSLGTHGGTITAGPECQLGFGVQLDAWGGHIAIGRHVFLGQHVVIYGHGGVEIGDHSLVSMHCCILSSDHTIPDRNNIIRNEPDIHLPTKIGRDVWLGAGVKVLGGVTIGDGCVVGAGAVVARDLPAHSIAVGVPARIIGQRS